MVNSYTWAMNLTIKNLQIGDFRAYLCTSDNGLGSDEARVRLQGTKDTMKLVLRIFNIPIPPFTKLPRITLTSYIDHNTRAICSKHTETQEKAAATTE